MDTLSVMLCCMICRRRSHRSNLLSTQFDRIESVYPGTVYVCLLNGSGDIIAQKTTTTPTTAQFIHPDELSSTISTLHRSVAVFAGTLQQSDTNVIHVKGDRHIFSTYYLQDNHILSFYSIMPSEDITKWNCAESDVKFEPIRLEIERVMRPTR